MGTFGFSYIGLIYLLMLFIPNGFWARNKPLDYDSSGENRTLLLLERIGQVCCSVTTLLFKDTNPQGWEPWLIWFFLSFTLMLAYLGFWLRYFYGPHSLADFYRPFLFVPVPGATLPVLAFFLLGIYGKLIYLIVAAIILGIGHIGIHIQHYKKLLKEGKL